jgi:MOSC domain-containing protein YiiM
MKIRHLFVSPGHNYFGHHGQPAGAHSIVPVTEVECVAGRGLRGDRFFDYKPDYKGQVTLFAWETFEALKIALPNAEPAALRRNVMVEGVSLDTLIGVEFSLQNVRLLGVEECRPCYWMDQAIGPGAEAWLKGRGGLRCRILNDGWLSAAA